MRNLILKEKIVECPAKTSGEIEDFCERQKYDELSLKPAKPVDDKPEDVIIEVYANKVSIPDLSRNKVDYTRPGRVY